jgi:hypothetical protein
MCSDDVLTLSAQRSESPPGGGEDAAEDTPPPPPASPVIGGLGTCGAAVVVSTAGGVQLPLTLLPRILRTVLGLPGIVNCYGPFFGVIQASLSLRSSWPGWPWRACSRTTTRWCSPRPSPRYSPCVTCVWNLGIRGPSATQRNYWTAVCAACAGY